jgi:hypothetical protein
MKYKYLSAVLVLGGLMGTASAEPVEFETGEWTYTITMTVPDLPIDPIVESESSCMQPWETRLEPTDLAQEFAGGAECTSSNVTQTANTVSFDMVCPDQALSAASIVMTHQTTGFSMDGDIKLDAGTAGLMDAKMKVIASRVGPCTE